MDENMDIMSESAEIQEVADPDVESEEMESVAETPARTESDAAFAEMRRRAESAERRAAELERGNSDMMQALGLYFDGDTSDKKIAQAIAHYEDRPLEDVERERRERAEYDNIRGENEVLRNELYSIRAEKDMADDLRALQSIDPTIKSLQELGPEYLDFRFGAADSDGIRHGTGLTAEQALWAMRSKEERNRLTPAQPIGKVNESPTEKEFLDRDEVMANRNNHEWMVKNHDKIRRSQSRW